MSVAEVSFTGKWVVWCSLCAECTGLHKTEKQALEDASQRGYAAIDAGKNAVCADCRPLMHDARPIL